MQFKFNVVEKNAWYSCSRKHKKIILSTKVLSLIIKSSLEKIIEHLDITQLYKDSHNYFQQIRKPIETELKRMKVEKNRLLEDIILKNDELSNWREHPHYAKLSELESKQEQNLFEVSKMQELLMENENLANLVKEYLHKCRQTNLFFLSSMLIKNIHIYENEVNLEISKFDYLQGLNTQYVFKGDELL